MPWKLIRLVLQHWVDSDSYPGVIIILVFDEPCLSLEEWSDF